RCNPGPNCLYRRGRARTHRPGPAKHVYLMFYYFVYIYSLLWKSMLLVVVAKGKIKIIFSPTNTLTRPLAFSKTWGGGCNSQRGRKSLGEHSEESYSDGLQRGRMIGKT